MKTAIDKNKLIQALDLVTKAVPTGKTTVPMLEGILFKTENNVLNLIKNNIESAIDHDVECKVVEAGSAIVNSKLICDIVRKLPDGELNISVADSKMTIKSGKVVMQVPVIGGQYPDMPKVVEKVKFEVDKKTFIDAINGVVFTVAEDEKRPTLAGVNISVANNMADIVACDGFTMAFRNISLQAPDFTVILNGKSLENAIKSLGDEGNMTASISDGIATLITDDTRITVRSIEGAYLAYKRMFLPDFVTMIRVNTKELVQSLERSLIFLETGVKGSIEEPLNISSKGESLSLKIKGGNGTFDEELFCDIEGEETKVGIDPRKLLTCLKSIEDKEVSLRVLGELKPVYIMPVKGDNYKYMLCVVRPK